MKYMTALLFAMTALVLIVAAWITITLKRENNRLEPKAKKYEEICDGVRWTLHTDMTLLHDTDDPPRLTPAQVEQERRHLYERVDTYESSPPMALMLERCMPHPFPMDAWRACSDDACLRTILKHAVDAIP